MDKAYSNQISFYSSVRAYRRHGRYYFINTLTGTWAVLPTKYAWSIINDNRIENESSLYEDTIEALAKSLIIRDKRYTQTNKNNTKKPLLIKLQTTGKCNFNCIYCFNNLTIREHSMDYQTLKRAVDYSFENPFSINGIYFSIYGGEPMMERKLLFDAISYIRKRSKERNDIFINIITNGSLLTDEDLIFLRANRVQISISFDGLPEFQDTNRKFASGNTNSQLVLENILKLKDYDLLNLLVTVTHNMSSRLLDIVVFMENNGISSVEFLPLRMLGVAENKKEISVNAKDYINSIKAIVEAIEADRIRHLKIRAVLRMLLPLETGQTLHGDIGRKRCGSGTTVISINYDGSITGCDMLPAEMSPVIGNIWDGITKLTDLDKNIALYGHVSAECSKCPWTLFCRSGCTGASGSDQNSCNTRHTLSCTINKELYPYLLEKMTTDNGRLHNYFVTHTTKKQI